MSGLITQTPSLMLRFIPSLLSATVFLGAPLLGQETEIAKTPAQEIAAGIAGLQNKHFEFDLSIKAEGENTGFQGASGHIIWGGYRHFSIEFSGSAITDLGEEEQSFKVVADGKDIYLESEEGIMKVNLDVIEELQPQLITQITEEGLGIAAEVSGEEGPDFESVLAAGLAKLTIKPLPSPLGAKDRRFSIIPEMKTDEEFGEDEADAPPEIMIAFGIDHWLPALITVDAGEGQGAEISASNILFTEEFAEGTFSYTPPEGAQVQDFTPMLQMMAMQMGGQPDDEDEVEF